MPAQPRSARSLLFKGLAVLIGLTFIGFGFKERSDFSRIRSAGKVAVVEPIKGYTTRKSKGSTTYTAEFVFKTEDGRDVATKHSFPEEILPDFQRGAPVKIYYDPRNPYEFIFEKDTNSWLIVGVGVAFAVVGAIFL